MGQHQISPDPSNKPLSIRRFLTLHPRERLFVHPLLWQERHIRLLGCYFASASNSESDHSDDDGLTPSGPRLADPPLRAEVLRQGTAAILAYSRSWSERELGFFNLADDINSRLVQESCRKKIWFYFKGRPIISLPCLAFPIPPPPGQQLPGLIALAYLDVDRLRNERVSYLEPRPDRLNRGNLPMRTRFLKLLKYHTPADPHRDPYFVAVLIALAQNQSRRYKQKDSEAAPSGFTSHLLVSERNSQWLHYFSAHVTNSFLERLDNPGATPAFDLALRVKHRRIPLEPYKTFSQRAARALGIEIEIPPDDNN